MRIAVCYDNGRISRHFERTGNFRIYDVEGGRITFSVVMGAGSGDHGVKIGLLRRIGADALLCDGIGDDTQAALRAAGIRIRSGVSGDADASVEAFLGSRA